MLRISSGKYRKFIESTIHLNLSYYSQANSYIMCRKLDEIGHFPIYLVKINRPHAYGILFDLRRSMDGAFEVLFVGQNRIMKYIYLVLWIVYRSVNSLSHFLTT